MAPVFAEGVGPSNKRHKETNQPVTITCVQWNYEGALNDEINHGYGRNSLPPSPAAWLRDLSLLAEIETPGWFLPWRDQLLAVGSGPVCTG